MVAPPPVPVTAIVTVGPAFFPVLTVTVWGVQATPLGVATQVAPVRGSAWEAGADANETPSATASAVIAAPTRRMTTGRALWCDAYSQCNPLHGLRIVPRAFVSPCDLRRGRRERGTLDSRTCSRIFIANGRLCGRSRTETSRLVTEVASSAGPGHCFNRWPRCWSTRPSSASSSGSRHHRWAQTPNAPVSLPSSFTGMVTFNLFSGLLMLSMTQLRSNGELLRKVHFPAWTPILGASVVQLVQVALELVVLVGMFLWQGNIGISWLLAVPILIATALFGQGVGLMLAVLNARFGDVQYIVQVVLQALYFLTPILYPLSLVESTANWLAWIVKANPLTWFVETMHNVMYSLIFPQWWVVPGLLLLGFAVFWAGFTIFNRTSEDIGELL